MRNIIKHNDELQWTNEYTSLQKYKSLTLYSRKGDVSYVWEVWRQGRTVILNQSSSDHSSTSSSSWLGLLNRGSLRDQSPLSAAGSQFGILSPTDSSRLEHLVILLSHMHLLPLFFRFFTQVHLLIDGSVEDQYVTGWGFCISTQVGNLMSNLVHTYISNMYDL